MFSLPRPVVAIMAVSLALRVGLALYQGSEIVPRLGVTDEVSYHTLAVRVLEGHGFSFATGWWPATRANQPTAHWSFLYVLFLAAVYSVTGPAPLAARLIQATAVGLLHPWLAWRIANRLFGPTAGLASAAIAAFYGYFVYYAGALVTESLYIVAVLWVIDIATSIAGRERDAASAWRPWAWLGVAVAVATLLRQLFLLVLPVVLAWLGWQLMRRRAATSGLSWLAFAGRAAIVVAVVVVAMLPWTARNYRAFGQLVPLNTNAGFVMYWANHPVHGTSFKPILSYGEVNYGTMLPDDVGALNEAQLDRELLRRGVGFVQDDPVRYVRLSLSRTIEYFKFWPSADSSLGSNLARVLSFGLLLPLLVVGVVMVVGRGRAPGPAADGAPLLLGVAALYTGLHLLTWTLVRYRLPVDAVLMPFAGVALAALSARTSPRG